MYICIYMYMYIHISLCMCVCMYMYMCMCMYMYIYPFARIFEFIHIICPLHVYSIRMTYLLHEYLIYMACLVYTKVCAYNIPSHYAVRRCVCIQIHAHTCLDACAYVYIHVCAASLMYVCVFVYTCVRVYVPAYTRCT